MGVGINSTSRSSREVAVAKNASSSPSASRRASSGNGQGGRAKTSSYLSDQAYKTVTEMILNRKLVGGELLVEGRLANSLNLTRTPLREALVRLEGEGLLVKQANRSFSVHIVGASEFFQSMKVRRYMEAEAAALAVGKVKREAIETLRARVVKVLEDGVQGPGQWAVDEALHAMIAEASGNAVLAKMIRKLRITTLLFEVSRPFGRAGADAEEHLAILQAMEDGDVDAARRAMVDHLKNIEQDVLEIVSGG